MSLDPGVALVPEAPEKSLAVWYTIDSGVATVGEQAPRQPSATVRFAQVVQLQVGGAPATNAFGMPAYRYAQGAVIWEYEVPLARLQQALGAAARDTITQALTRADQGQTPTQIITGMAMEGYPELSMRRQIDVIESERRAGTLDVVVRMVQGTAAPGPTP